MSTWWCEYAQLPDGLHKGVRLTVDDGRITAVEARTTPAAGDERLAGVVLPGLANVHSHAFHRALRGRTHGDGGNFWTWREQMYAVTRRLDPQRYLALARAVFAEMVLAGYTVVGEFHYLHHDVDGRPYADPNAMGAALAEAARDAGIRITLLDTVYLSGGLFGSGHQPLDDVQVRFTDGSVGAWEQRIAAFDAGPHCKLGAAIHSVRAVPREHLAEVARVAGGGVGHGPLPLHIHLSEQPAENLACESFYGLSPTALLQAEGVLGSGTTAVHATHLSDDDIALLGETGTTACFCPTTERDLADGIGPAMELARAGSPLTLGSDQHAVIDPFEEIRGLEMNERLRSLERGRFTSGELLYAAGPAGHRALGWSGGGVLAVGALADFVAVSIDGPRTAGCGPDQILYAATGADVTDVVTAGEPVVRGRAHRLGDVGALLRSAISPLRASS